MLSNLTVNNHNITDRAVWRYQVFIIFLSASPVSPLQWRCFLLLLGAFKAVKYSHHWPSCQFGSTTLALCLKVNGALMSTTFMSRWLFGTFRNQQLLPSTVNLNWLCRPVLSFWNQRLQSLSLLLPGSITGHATMALLFGLLVHVIASWPFSVLFFRFAYRSHGAVIFALAFVDHHCQHRHFST